MMSAMGHLQPSQRCFTCQLMSASPRKRMPGWRTKKGVEVDQTSEIHKLPNCEQRPLPRGEELLCAKYLR
jgi:hypothetical protein